VKIFSPKLWLGAVAALGLSAQRAEAKFQTIDLTSGNAAVALYSTNTDLGTQNYLVGNSGAQGTGTGAVDSFVRVQTANGNATQESGYNTSAGTPLDTKGGSFTHDIQLKDIPIVKIAGISYREFQLDVAQNNNINGVLKNVSLNQIQIFQSSGAIGYKEGATKDYTIANASGTSDALININNATEVFRLNDAIPLSDNTEIQVGSSHGNGAGDMYFYVRDSYFTGGANSYITLFSQFGIDTGTFEANGSFEEWYVKKQLPGEGGGTSGGGAVPAPAGLVLLASAVPMMAFRRVFRRKMAGN